MEPDTISHEEKRGVSTYVAIVLAIIALILLVLWLKKPSEPVSETFNDISSQLAECQDRLNAYQDRYGTGPAPSDDAQAELDSILADCKDVINSADTQI